MIIICTPDEQIILKRNIKADECKPLCEHKSQCTKPKDMTCGEYIISKIEWRTNEEV